MVEMPAPRPSALELQNSSLPVRLTLTLPETETYNPLSCGRLAGMGLSDQMMADQKVAMRNHQEIRLSTIRMARAAIINEQIEKRRPLEEAEVLSVLVRQVKHCLLYTSPSPRD